VTVKERIIERIEKMSEAELLEIEKDLAAREAQVRIRRQLEALEEVAGMLSDPKEYALFEEAARRRSMFGGRTLDLEPDE
jgi:hypothetical protein